MRLTRSAFSNSSLEGAVSNRLRRGNGLPFAFSQARTLILGAGPTGLGAAHRMSELGLSNFLVCEKEKHAGGLASSFTDLKGFIWDIGGHVQFSHYRYFDDLMDSLLGEQWLHHQRESWIWIRDVFLPYPFQNNLRYLPKSEMEECLDGVMRVGKAPKNGQPGNFEQWIYASFGAGIAKHFLLPYNYKVWGYPPTELAFHWVGERVAKLDVERILTNIREGRDDVSWGPNNTFRYPLHGGTGETWRRLAQRLPAKIQFQKAVCHIDTRRKTLGFSDGTSENYDLLISTIPLDVLIKLSDLKHLAGAVEQLRYSTVHVLGIGLKGTPPPHLKTKCWMYFPEDSSPFYRATVLSNYSPNVVPDITQYWSLMLEVSESPAKPLQRERLIDSVISGLLATRLIGCRNDIVNVWHYIAEHGYPTPSLERDSALEALLPALEDLHIFSRGRFGAWRYEVSNQDHALMQGVELIDRLAGNGAELTVWEPDLVNTRPKV